MKYFYLLIILAACSPSILPGVPSDQDDMVEEIPDLQTYRRLPLTEPSVVECDGVLKFGPAEGPLKLSFPNIAQDAYMLPRYKCRVVFPVLLQDDDVRIQIAAYFDTKPARGGDHDQEIHASIGVSNGVEDWILWADSGMHDLNLPTGSSQYKYLWLKETVLNICTRDCEPSGQAYFLVYDISAWKK